MDGWRAWVRWMSEVEAGRGVVVREGSSWALRLDCKTIRGGELGAGVVGWWLQRRALPDQRDDDSSRSPSCTRSNRPPLHLRAPSREPCAPRVPACVASPREAASMWRV